MSKVNSAQGRVRVAVRVTGLVQGVGFRPFVYRLASEERLEGFVRNDGRGVYIEIQGEPEAVNRFLGRMRSEPPPGAAVFSVDSKSIETVDDTGFSIGRSGKKELGPLPVSPDLATCRSCLREVFAPADRRYRYAFANCTHCGPRFTIVTSVPYDRPNTTMRAFNMCSSCRAEYEDPGDRRFHAQPNACPDCGPQIELVERGRDGARGELALEKACMLLAEGKILAVKGMGGYHLACDGTSESAVSRLRRRKHRYDRPFALMVRDVETLKELCSFVPAERVLIESAAAPIVLLVRRDGTTVGAFKEPARVMSRPSSRDGGFCMGSAGFGENPGPGAHYIQQTDVADATGDRANIELKAAPSVAPGLRRLGVMLPYTPLHHMLLMGGPRVLVMTSGNVSEEPIAYSDDEAMERLADIADAFLTHNRPIRTRCDDSVAWVPDGCRPQMIRRSRGYAPAPMLMPVATPIPLLAVGGHFKNTFCLSHGDTAYLSHHVGDTSNAEALRSFEDGVEHFKTLFSLRPEAVAYDMHPDYLTTKYAQEMALSVSIPVQHHHAHVAACMAENEVPPGTRVLGAAFDGSGYGPDGTIWGGEFLLCTYQDYERYAHMEYMPLPGGEAAVREPWRLAAFAAEKILGPDFHVKPLPLRTLLEMDKWQVISKAVQRNVNSPLCCSVGRLFDCISAILGVRGRVNYEGQAAVELEAVAMAEPAALQDSGRMRRGPFDRVEEVAPYPVLLQSHTIRWEPIVGGVIEDALRGVPIGLISLRFHRTVAEAILVVARRARRDAGVDAVALTGGVFMNELLHCLGTGILSEDGFTVYTHSWVPANDGGIAFGQAVAAAAKLAGA